MTECLYKDPHSEKHYVVGRFEFRGPDGEPKAQSQTLFSDMSHCTLKHCLIIPAFLRALQTLEDFPNSGGVFDKLQKKPQNKLLSLSLYSC